MADESSGYGEVLNRRRFVELVGVTGAAAIAGCSQDGGTPSAGDGDGGDGESSDGGSGDGGSGDGSSSDGGSSDGGSSDGESSGMTVHDVRHVSGTNKSPKQVQFNPWGSNPAQIADNVIYDKLANFNYADGEFKPALLSEWGYTGDAFEMTIQEGATWHNGDPVTAQDLKTYFEIQQVRETSTFDFADGVEKVDDRTVALTIPGKVNPSLIEFAALRNQLTTKHDVYKDVLSEMQDNPDSKALAEKSIKDPVGNGLFKNAEANEQARLTTRFADHPDAENVNFEEYVFKYLDSNTQIHQSLVSDSIDSQFNVYAPAHVVADLPDAMTEYQTPTNGGVGIVPNHDHKDLGKRKVRQAIAYVINREQVAFNSDPRTKIAPRVPTALPNAQQDKWLGNLDEWETYGRDTQMTDKAASLLQEAGYSKSDGTWMDENGEALSFTLDAPAGWTDWEVAMETSADQLSSFGIDASFTTTPYGQLGGTDGAWYKGEFDAVAGYWTAAFARAAHPYYNLRYQMVAPGEMLRWYKFNYEGAKSGDPPAGDAADVTVPARSGGGTMTVNPVEDVKELSTVDDEERERELARDLLWASNQDLPMIPLQEKLTQTFISGTDWDIPESDAPEAQVKYANTWLPRLGEMQYTGN